MADGRKTLLDSELHHPTGITLSGDGLWLAVAERHTRWGYSYRILANGLVDAKQRFYRFLVPDEQPDSGAEQLAQDRDGRLYAATRMGIQIFDRSGRSRAIMPLECGPARGLAWAGSDFDTLYVSCANGALYRRQFKIKGTASMDRPVVLPDWIR